VPRTVPFALFARPVQAIMLLEQPCVPPGQWSLPLNHSLRSILANKVNVFSQEKPCLAKTKSG
jgi:hypothetical protein